MSQQKKSTIGDPIWVESLLTTSEHSKCHSMYPKTVLNSKPIEFNPNYHAGGKWRAGMGFGFSSVELNEMGKAMDKLYDFMKNHTAQE